eukprot:1812666-Pleurochrysis_carterae.AAC.1
MRPPNALFGPAACPTAFGTRAASASRRVCSCASASRESRRRIGSSLDFRDALYYDEKQNLVCAISCFK